jgi:hypothetical protein
MSKANFGLMALNMRNRIENISDQHAGNYEGSLIMLPEFSAVKVRTSLKKLALTEPPTFSQSCFGYNAVVSNWASFYHELILPTGIIPVNHHPLERDPVHMVNTTGIIYKPTANKICLLFGDLYPNAQTEIFVNQ